MMPMYFKLYRNPENKSLVIPRAALQLSDLMWPSLRGTPLLR